ncbi:MAG: hypothetical protein ONB23_07875 [candidate division KSB1 bacterium]|nr:hypothetical protein [candidate division KSB1 bacterium]
MPGSETDATLPLFRDIPELKSSVCWLCGAPTPHGYVFCSKCTPPYGKQVLLRSPDRRKGKAVFVGTIPIAHVIARRILGWRIVKWWMGTDALTMWMCPPGIARWKVLAHRWKMRLLEPLISEHWVTGRNLIADLSRARGIDGKKLRIVYWPGRFQSPVRREPHPGFNVLYYDPGGGTFKRWVYGIDVIEELRRRFPNVNWIRLDGTQDTSRILPTVDVYIRPTRHDGAPRIVEECRISGIPVIFSEDGKPDVQRIAAELQTLVEAKTRNSA